MKSGSGKQRLFSSFSLCLLLSHFSLSLLFPPPLSHSLTFFLSLSHFSLSLCALSLSFSSQDGTPNILLPNDARLRNLTYSGTLMLSMRLDKHFADGTVCGNKNRKIKIAQ